MAIAGTMMILIVQCICSIAVVVYFHVAKQHPETANWWRTLVAPSLGAIGMGYVVYLLGSHLEFAAGAASTSPVFAATPWIVIAIFGVGLVCGLVLRARAPERYALIGRTVLAESASD
jgi:amino acid transporter